MEYKVSGNCDISSILFKGEMPSEGMCFGKNVCPYLNDSTVEPNHLQIYSQNGKWYAKDLSSFGSFLKLVPAQPTRVKYGSFVLFGKTWMTTNDINKVLFQDEKFTVVCQFTPTKNMQYTLGRAGGKGEPVSIAINGDSTLSSNHAKFTFYDDFVEVIDGNGTAGSTNGTYYSVGNMLEINKNMVIRIGVETWLYFAPKEVSGTVKIDQQVLPGQRPKSNFPGDTVYINEHGKFPQVYQPTQEYMSPQTLKPNVTIANTQYHQNMYSPILQPQINPNSAPLFTPAYRPQVNQPNNGFYGASKPSDGMIPPTVKLSERSNV